MTLDEAIKHCEDVAEDRCGCAEDCVNEHRQLAEWLKELKAYRVADTPQNERSEFVKVSDRECPWCKAVCASTDKYCHECGWHIADTPQTDCEDISCPYFKNPDYSRCMRCKSQTDCQW